MGVDEPHYSVRCEELDVFKNRSRLGAVDFFQGAPVSCLGAVDFCFQKSLSPRRRRFIPGNPGLPSRRC